LSYSLPESEQWKDGGVSPKYWQRVKDTTIAKKSNRKY
jgi:hypothetical protein